MKKFIAMVLIAAVAVAGCAKKPVERTEITQARKLLVEGTMFLKQADAAKAVQSFAAAIKVAPDYFEGYYLLSETLIRLKQFPQAEAVLIATIKQFPDNGLGYYLLAIAHEGAGNTVPAIIAARKSLELFTAKNDKEAQQRATVLLAALINQAKQLSEEGAIKNAAVEAQKAVESRNETAVPVPASQK
jgi:tetratricopeptide (TPR) repeat protein